MKLPPEVIGRLTPEEVVRMMLALIAHRLGITEADIAKGAAMQLLVRDNVEGATDENG